MSVADESCLEAHLETNLPPGMPEEWRYDHDLPCPNCGYNLRMRRTPWCPECGEAYTWQLLLNLSCARCGASLTREAGERCPECDLELDWAALIDGVNPQSVRTFEYATRPVRAALATLRQALRPRRFWERQILEMKPHTSRLRAMLISVLLFYGVICVLTILLRLLFGWSLNSVIAKADIAAALIAVFLPLTTFIMLPAFGPSLKLCRIRRDQLLRIAAYGMSGIFWATLFCLGMLCVATIYNLHRLLWDYGQSPVFICSALLRRSWAYNIWSVRLSGYESWAYTLFQTVWWWPFLWFALRGFLRLKRRDALVLEQV